MEILKDIFYTNRNISKKALTTLIKNWPIIFTGLFYSIATSLLALVSGSLGILAGLVLIIATSALISNYLYLLENILRTGSFDFQDFKNGFTPYLNKIWSILFIAYVAELIISFVLDIFYPLMAGIGPIALHLIISVLTFALFNPLPEAVYQKHYSPWDTITYTIDFVKDNWIEWFVPNLVMLLIIHLATAGSINILGLVSNIFNYFISFTYLYRSPKGLVVYIIGQILFSYFMIYRAYLFESLSTSSRRKRLFMREF